MSNSNLSFNFLNNMEFWGSGLNVIRTRMPHKLDDFAKSLEKNHMDGGIWMVERLKDYIDEFYMKEGGMKIMIINSWIGLPFIPLLCENLDVSELHLVDLDKEALELSQYFNRYYSQEKFVKQHLYNYDVPFEFERLNKIDADIVICMNSEQLYPLKELSTANPYAIFAVQNSNVVTEMYGINCMKDIDDLKESVGLEEIGYEGRIRQEYHDWQGRKEYDRFMIIGQKQQPFS